jgi:hypothetical protein
VKGRGMARAVWVLSAVLCGTLGPASESAAQAPAATAAPAGYDALYEQATNELATGNWAGARALFAQAHELYPNATTLRGLGVAELELGQHERAATLLERALGSSVRPLSPALRAQTEAALARARGGAPAPAPAPPPPPMAPPPPVPLPPPAATLPPPPGAYRQVDAAPPAPRRDSAVAASLGGAAIVPFEGYADETRGMGLYAGVWVQVGNLVFEPRIGMLWDVADDSRGYFHLPVELGTYLHLPVGDHSLFIGPGLGLHALFERVDVSRTVGSSIVASSRDRMRDDAVGFGVFGRAGFVLMRTSPVSLVPSIEYGYTFADLLRADDEQALRVNVSLLFGGGR